MAGGDITSYESTSGLSVARLGVLFNHIYKNISARLVASRSTKENIEAYVLNVIVATSGNPLAGLGVAVK